MVSPEPPRFVPIPRFLPICVPCCREEHYMDQCRSRLKLSENFERHWSIRISGEIHMDQSLVHTFSWGNSYGPMVLKVLLKFPPTLVLVHGWLFPVLSGMPRCYGTKNQLEVFQTEVCSWTSVCAACPCQNACFPEFEGPD